jgi:hypothetical protein
MSSQQQRVPYTAKHAFAGTPQQSQLSFHAGDTVYAVPGQTGAWWWGNWCVLLFVNGCMYLVGFVINVLSPCTFT